MKYQSPNFNFSFDYPAKYGVAKPQTKVNRHESEMPLSETITFENNPNIEIDSGDGGYYLVLGKEGFEGIGGEFTKTKNGFTAQINPFKKEYNFIVTGVVSMFNLDTLFPSYRTDIWGQGLLITARNLNQSESEVYREEIRDILESAIYDIKEEVLPDEFLKDLENFISRQPKSALKTCYEPKSSVSINIPSDWECSLSYEGHFLGSIKAKERSLNITVRSSRGGLFCNDGPAFLHSDKCKISKFYETKSGARFSIFKYEMVGVIDGSIYLNDMIGHVGIYIIYDDIVNTELDSETRKEIEDFLDQFQKPIYPFR